jgi:hypothetical protein
MEGTKFLVFILLATVQRSHVDADRYVFASDAAGRRPPGATELTGAASIGYLNKKKKTWFGCQLYREPQLYMARSK